MGRWYKVSGQYDDGFDSYSKTILVFGEDRSDVTQKIYHKKFPYGGSFLPCTVTELDKNEVYFI